MSMSRCVIRTAAIGLLLLAPLGCEKEASKPPAPAASGMGSTGGGQPDVSGGAGMADAVPISVSVTPVPTDAPTKLTITARAPSDMTADTEWLVFYDVRNKSAADPNRHVDADLILQMKDAVRKVTCKKEESSVTFDVDLVATRPHDAEVHVMVVGLAGSDWRGALGKKDIAKPAEPTAP